MKAKLFLLALLAAQVVCAQHTSALTFILQPQSTRGGDFYAPTSGSSNPTYTPADKKITLGLRLGCEFDYSLNEKMGMSAGLFYSKQGQKCSYSGIQTVGSLTDNFTIDGNAALHYLQIPIHFHFVAKPENKLSVCFSGGLYMGFLVGYRHEVTVTDNLSNGRSSSVTQTAKGSALEGTSTDFNGHTDSYVNGFLTKPFKGLDLGAIIGTGVRIKVSEKISLPIMLNYQAGFKNVKNISSQYTTGSGSNNYWLFFYDGNDPNQTSPFHNSALGISFGLQMHL
jgi:hypothetical protein